MTGKEIIKILEQRGWKVLRVAGSHHRMGKGSFCGFELNWPSNYHFNSFPFYNLYLEK